MSGGPHRIGPADQQAALRLARAILTGRDGEAHDIAEAGGDCPACTAMAAVSFAFAVISTAWGDQMALSETTQRRLLNAVAAAEADLRGGLS